MTKLADFIYTLSFYILKYIGVLFASLLFISALLFSSADTDITTLHTSITPDNLLSGIGSLLFLLFGILLIKLPCRKAPAKTVHISLAITLGAYAIIGTLLILFVKSGPHTDSFFVYKIAGNCAMNNFEDIHLTSYLSVYPHQIGLVFFYEPLLRLWNVCNTKIEGYLFLQFVNLLLTLVLIYFLYKIVYKLFKNEYTTVCSLLMLLFCLPLYFYILRVYGDIPSLALFVVGLWAFIEIISSKKKKNFPLCLLSILCFILSVATRKNIIIALIALMIVTLLIVIYKKRYALLLLFGSYLFIAVFTLPAIQTLYETRADSQLDVGTPAIAYITMGMQKAPHANGWYNGFNYNVYVESGHNMQFINNYSKKLINERLTYFKENPKEAYAFYFEKCISQWCDSTYASMELTAYTASERHPIIQNFYAKNGGMVYIFICNIFQTLLFFGTLVFCISNCVGQTKKDVIPYIGILIAFGGFLFHILWEANTRAIFPYTIVLLPVAASGLTTLIQKLSFSNMKCILHKFYKKIIHNLF